jgi:hypothetical protein
MYDVTVSDRMTAPVVDTPGASPACSVELPIRNPGFTLVQVLAAPTNPSDGFTLQAALPGARAPSQGGQHRQPRPSTSQLQTGVLHAKQPTAADFAGLK